MSNGAVVDCEVSRFVFQAYGNSMRADAVRAEVIRMVRGAPFRPFILSTENGDRVTIGHPENIAFEPEGEATDFYVVAGGVRLYGTFEAVSSVATADSIENLA